MISRLCSIVESSAEKLFLIGSGVRAGSGVRGVSTPCALGQFSGVGHLGYRALQLNVQVGLTLLSLVTTIGRKQCFVSNLFPNPDDVLFDHRWGDAVIRVVFVKLGAEFPERFQ